VHYPWGEQKGTKTLSCRSCERVSSDSKADIGQRWRRRAVAYSGGEASGAMSDDGRQGRGGEHDGSRQGRGISKEVEIAVGSGRR
jgi:hypothetical protein